MNPVYKTQPHVKKKTMPYMNKRRGLSLSSYLPLPSEKYQTEDI